ncbi:MAG: TetR/AcrR family transcriptional regulator [Candidatus Tectomicrobia bacterium]|nr:TetR/AcrR family transcriptional regulator [Candidatus Tectomicrobia bacterium]
MQRTREKITKAEIVKAALELFVERGIKGTTTRELAERAGIAEGTIYRHFKGKDALALTLFMDCLDMFSSRLMASIQDLKNPFEKLKAAIKAFFNFAREEPSAYRYLMFVYDLELMNVPQQKLKPRDIFCQIILQGIASSDFRRCEENLAAAMIIGMAMRANFFWSHGFIKLDYDQLISEVARAALAILV